MTLIPAAGKSFQMGQIGVTENVHTVNFVFDFWMDTTEVTQDDYNAIMGVNPSFHTGDLCRPVERLTWFDAALYCNARSKRSGLDTVYKFKGVVGIPGSGCTGLVDITIDYSVMGYRLPTEAEWEYACRGETTTEYYWGSASSSNYAWYIANSANSTHPVAKKLPNNFNLYDMSGNAIEWCNDWYEPASNEPQTNSIGPSNGTHRILRGGSFAYEVTEIRSAYRSKSIPINSYNDGGFRVVLPIR
jgi:formylglycine-generating enzyme required for sulfatase activity